jgi:hypothetical protein
MQESAHTVVKNSKNNWMVRATGHIQDHSTDLSIFIKKGKRSVRRGFFRPLYCPPLEGGIVDVLNYG